MATVGEHLTRVRALYKAILKLHCGLPLHMKALGDQYVKDEFRRHKKANKEEVDIFMHEWTKYFVTLARQLGPKRQFKTVGENLSPELLDNFNHEQVAQLKELLEAAAAPSQQVTSETKGER